MAGPLDDWNRGRSGGAGVSIYNPRWQPQQTRAPVTRPRPAGGGMANTFLARLQAENPLTDEEEEEGDSGWGRGLGAIVNNPVTQGILKPLEIIDIPRRGIMSTAKEVGDLIEGRGFSGSDWMDQVQDPTFGFGDILPDPTGNKWLDRTIGFAGDVAFDPLTYLTFGAAPVAGTAGRAANASKLLRQVRIAEAAGDAPTLRTLANITDNSIDDIGQLRDAARAEVQRIATRGPSVATNAQLNAMDLPQQGARFGTRNHNVRVPGSGTVARTVNRATSKTRVGLSNSLPMIDRIRRARSPKGLEDQIKKIATGHGEVPIEDALDMLQISNFWRRGEGAFKEEMARAVNQANEKLKADNVLTKSEQVGSQTVINDLMAEARRIAAKYDSEIPELAGEAANVYVPHILNRQFRDYLRKNVDAEGAWRSATGMGTDDLLEESRFVQKRRFTPNEDGTPRTVRFGEPGSPGGGREITITKGTIEELNSELRRVFPEYRGKFYETDPQIIMESYIDSVARQVGRDYALNRAMATMPKVARLEEGAGRVVAGTLDDEFFEPVKSASRTKDANEATAKALAGQQAKLEGQAATIAADAKQSYQGAIRSQLDHLNTVVDGWGTASRRGPIRRNLQDQAEMLRDKQARIASEREQAIVDHQEWLKGSRARIATLGRRLGGIRSGGQAKRVAYYRELSKEMDELIARRNRVMAEIQGMAPALRERRDELMEMSAAYRKAADDVAAGRRPVTGDRRPLVEELRRQADEYDAELGDLRSSSGEITAQVENFRKVADEMERELFEKRGIFDIQQKLDEIGDAGDTLTPYQRKRYDAAVEKFRAIERKESGTLEELNTRIAQADDEVAGLQKQIDDLRKPAETPLPEGAVVAPKKTPKGEVGVTKPKWVSLDDVSGSADREALFASVKERLKELRVERRKLKLARDKEVLARAGTDAEDEIGDAARQLATVERQIKEGETALRRAQKAAGAESAPTPTPSAPTPTPRVGVARLTKDATDKIANLENKLRALKRTRSGLVGRRTRITSQTKRPLADIDRYEKIMRETNAARNAEIRPLQQKMEQVRAGLGLEQGSSRTLTGESRMDEIARYRRQADRIDEEIPEGLTIERLAQETDVERAARQARPGQGDTFEKAGELTALEGQLASRRAAVADIATGSDPTLRAIEADTMSRTGETLTNRQAERFEQLGANHAHAKEIADLDEQTSGVLAALERNAQEGEDWEALAARSRAILDNLGPYNPKKPNEVTKAIQDFLNQMPNMSMTDDGAETTAVLLNNLLDNLLKREHLEMERKLVGKELKLANDNRLHTVFTSQLKDQWSLMRKGAKAQPGDIVMDAELARRFQNLHRVTSDAKMLGKTLTAFTNFFKTYATLTPGFHVRNAMSATFMNASDGVPLSTQMKGIRIWRQYVEGGEAWLSKQSAEVQAAFEATFASGAGGRFTESGVAAGPVAGMAGEKIFKNRATKWSQRMGQDWVEGPVRLSMALDTMSKYSGKKWADVADDATNEALDRITRIHFDYGQTSQFDETARRLIPFWTFMSRNLPLQVTQMWTKPRAYNHYSSFVRNFRGEDDDLAPSYFENIGAFPFADVKVGGNPLYLQPDLPHLRVTEEIDNWTNFAQGKDMLRPFSDFNPFFTAPVELMTGKDFFTGRTFDETDVSKAGGLYDPIARLLAPTQFSEVVDGQPVIQDRMANFLRALLPPLDRSTRLFPQSAGEVGDLQRQLEGIARTFGIPVRSLTDEQRESTRWSEYFDERDQRAEQEAMLKAVAGR